MICPAYDDNLCGAWHEDMAHTNYMSLIKYYSDHPVPPGVLYDTTNLHNYTSELARWALN